MNYCLMNTKFLFWGDERVVMVSVINAIELYT